MKSNDEMFSVGEIIQSKAFEREAPEEMKFLLRRLRRDAERETSTANRKKNSNLQVKNIGVISKTDAKVLNTFPKKSKISGKIDIHRRGSNA